MNKTQQERLEEFRDLTKELIETVDNYWTKIECGGCIPDDETKKLIELEEKHLELAREMFQMKT